MIRLTRRKRSSEYSSSSTNASSVHARSSSMKARISWWVVGCAMSWMSRLGLYSMARSESLMVSTLSDEPSRLAQPRMEAGDVVDGVGVQLPLELGLELRQVVGRQPLSQAAVLTGRCDVRVHLRRLGWPRPAELLHCRYHPLADDALRATDHALRPGPLQRLQSLTSAPRLRGSPVGGGRPSCGLGSVRPVDVGAAFDRNDGHPVGDPIDDPEVPAPGAVEPLQLEPQGFPYPRGVLG
jgi:hypothetical protein